MRGQIERKWREDENSWGYSLDNLRRTSRSGRRKASLMETRHKRYALFGNSCDSCLGKIGGGKMKEDDVGEYYRDRKGSVSQLVVLLTCPTTTVFPLLHVIKLVPEKEGEYASKRKGSSI